MSGNKISILLITFVWLAPAARAHLYLCNKTKEKVSAVIAIFNKDCGSGHYDTKGWYDLAPNQCETVWTGEAKDKRFYYFAQDQSACHTWKGTGTRILGVPKPQDSWITKHNTESYWVTKSDSRDFVEFISPSRDYTLNFTHD